MKRHTSTEVRVLLALLGCLLLTCGAAQAREPFKEIPGTCELSGRMIARPMQPEAWLDKGVGSAEAAARIERAREMMAPFDIKERVLQTDEYVFFVPRGKTEDEVADELLDSGLFQYVHPDWRVFTADCPDDPSFGSQWHHGVAYLRSCDAWDVTTGSPSVRVGIVDTGIDTAHPDLVQNRVEGYNGITQLWESQGGDVTPLGSHGTATTGCAAATGNNGVGVVGSGWNIGHRMLVPIEVAGGAYLADLLHCARVSIEAGDRVASVSWGFPDEPATRTTATYIKSIGGLLFWAAGNDGRNLNANHRDADDVIIVGNSNQNDEITPGSAYGIYVDLFAPGDQILTTSTAPDPPYVTTGGTSLSCPIVAGLAAMIWAAYPSFSPDEVEALIKFGCDDIGSPGVDATYGYGRINSYRSLMYAPNVYVDFTYSGVETGSFWYPYNTMAEGILHVPTGGVVAIKAGSSAETPNITKAMTIVNWREEVSVGE